MTLSLTLFEQPTKVGPAATIVRYQLVGTAGPSRDVLSDLSVGVGLHRVGTELTIRTIDRTVLAFTTAKPESEAGDVVVTSCRMELMWPYEWEGFDLPDVRRNWVIRDAVSVQNRVHSLHGFHLDLEPVP